MISIQYKKLALIFIILVSIISLVYVFTKLRTSQTADIYIPTPNIPILLKTKYKILSTIKKEDFAFPKSVPLINIQADTKITKEDAQQIANNTGFTGEPKTTNDVFDGTAYVWSTSQDSLIIFEKSSRIEYSINSIDQTINKHLTDKDIQETAENFLTQKLLFDKNDINFSFFSFLKSTGDPEGINLTTKEKAFAYQVNFNPKISSEKILSLDPKSSLIYVWVLPNGTIAKVSAIKLSRLEKSQTEFPLKTYDEVIQHIGDAVVVSLDDGNINLQDASNNINEITLNTITLAYLYTDHLSEFLQPVYLLNGSTNDLGQDGSVNASLYLPAISNP